MSETEQNTNGVPVTNSEQQNYEININEWLRKAKESTKIQSFFNRPGIFSPIKSPGEAILLLISPVTAPIAYAIATAISAAIAALAAIIAAGALCLATIANLLGGTVGSIVSGVAFLVAFGAAAVAGMAVLSGLYCAVMTPVSIPVNMASIFTRGFATIISAITSLLTPGDSSSSEEIINNNVPLCTL